MGYKRENPSYRGFQENVSMTFKQTWLDSNLKNRMQVEEILHIKMKE